MLSDGEKKGLLELARHTLTGYFTKTKTFLPSAGDFLSDRKGAFVTLHNGGELRGCIGQLLPDRSLSEVVRHCVISAATEDTRFEPVTSDEVPHLHIEISVLSPFRRIQQIEEIEVGKHGLYMVHGYFRGLLLPQVAAEYGWDRMTFLKHTCHKSGLPESAWQDPETEIYIFEAEVFSE